MNSRRCRWHYISTVNTSDAHSIHESCRAASGVSRTCGDLCQSLCNYVDGRGRCAALIPAYNAPYGGAACSVICPYMTDTGDSTTPETTGNTINCRLYYAQRGQWYNTSDDCAAAQLSSVDGKCTRDTGVDASIDTYCDNHIKSCGYRSDTNPNGQYASYVDCWNQAQSFRRASYRNDFIGDTLECRLNYAFQAVDTIWRNDTCRDTGPVSYSYCSDQSCASYCAMSQYACGSVSADDYDPPYACTIDWCPSFPDRSDQVNATHGDSRQWYVAITRVFSFSFVHRGVTALYDSRVTYAKKALSDPSQCYAAGVVSYQPASISNTSMPADACGSIYDIYCDFMMDGCGTTRTGANPTIFGQYESRDECLALARAVFYHDGHRPWRSLAPGDMSIECRLGFAFATVKEDRSVCAKAGLVPYGDITGSCDRRFGCDSYCQLALQACPYAYASLQQCYNLCSYDHDIANQEVDTITSGDSSNCRGYHAARALVTPDASTKYLYCSAVGVRSANGNATYGTCGSDCDVYCRLVQTICGTATNTSQYDSVDACLHTCVQMHHNGSMGDMDGNTFHCRLSHIMTVATEVPVAHPVLVRECSIAGAQPTARCITPPPPSPDDDKATPWYLTLGAIIGMSVGGLLLLVCCSRCAYKRYHERRIERLLNDEVAGWSHIPDTRTDVKW